VGVSQSSSGNFLDIKKIGNREYLAIEDVGGIFKLILIELKINNAYLKEIVGEKLTEIDTEG